MRHVAKGKGFPLHWALMVYLYDVLESIHWASVLLFDRKTQQLFHFAVACATSCGSNYVLDFWFSSSLTSSTIYFSLSPCSLLIVHYHSYAQIA